MFLIEFVDVDELSGYIWSFADQQILLFSKCSRKRTKDKRRWKNIKLYIIRRFAWNWFDAWHANAMIYQKELSRIPFRRRLQTLKPNVMSVIRWYKKDKMWNVNAKKLFFRLLKRKEWGNIKNETTRRQNAKVSKIQWLHVGIPMPWHLPCHSQLIQKKIKMLTWYLMNVEIRWNLIFDFPPSYWNFWHLIEGKWKRARTFIRWRVENFCWLLVCD